MWRVVSPDPHDCPVPLPMQRSGRGGAALDLRWTLGEFFARWFAPRMLCSATPRTRDNYRSTLAWWSATTEDWPLWRLAADPRGAQEQVELFARRLRSWGYSRRVAGRGQACLIGPLGPGLRPLAAETVAEHLRRLATLLRYLGPRPLTARRPHAELVPRPPLVPPAPREAAEPRRGWPLETARAILAAAETLRRRRVPTQAVAPRRQLSLPSALWWRLLLGALYYTGLRAGTVLALRWEHVDLPSGCLRVPASITKSRRGLVLSLHPQLAALLAELAEGQQDQDALVVPPRYCRRYLLTLHARAQRVAGVPEGQVQGLHAWRRTHLEQLYLLGATRGLELAAAAADHTDPRVTQQHYVAAAADLLRRALPPLWP